MSADEKIRLLGEFFVESNELGIRIEQGKRIKICVIKVIHASFCTAISKLCMRFYGYIRQSLDLEV